MKQILCVKNEIKNVLSVFKQIYVKEVTDPKKDIRKILRF